MGSPRKRGGGDRQKTFLDLTENENFATVRSAAPAKIGNCWLPHGLTNEMARKPTKDCDITGPNGDYDDIREGLSRNKEREEDWKGKRGKISKIGGVKRKRTVDEKTEDEEEHFGKKKGRKSSTFDQIQYENDARQSRILHLVTEIDEIPEEPDC